MRIIGVLLLCFLITSCVNKKEKLEKTEEAKSQAQITLITLDPGHFHAALVQKISHKEINDSVFVYAPKGDDLQGYLSLIKGFNTRAEYPTSWKTNIYEAPDYLDRMLKDKKGNVLVVSGKNNRKIGYMEAAVENGIHVYADKPLVIDSQGFEKLEGVFEKASKQNLLVYDVMTERFEITTILQRLLSMKPEIFGELIEGTAEEPAITKESVHHFSKLVAGKPLIRPAWFFDTEQRGGGLNDVSTHLVDLVQWEAFPNQILSKNDVEIVNAKLWATKLNSAQFENVTGLNQYPAYLNKDLKKDELQVYSNGSITYKIKGKFAKTSVIWNFKAPVGTGDTHNSIMRGEKCDLIIKQGALENFKPKLYIQLKEETDIAPFEKLLNEFLKAELATKYPGLTLTKLDTNLWTVIIPKKYKIGHEAHFGEVTKNYIQYFKDGK